MVGISSQLVSPATNLAIESPGGKAVLHFGREHAKIGACKEGVPKRNILMNPAMGAQESHLREVTGENVVAGGSLGPGVCFLEQARAGLAANLQLDRDAQESLLGFTSP